MEEVEVTTEIGLRDFTDHGYRCMKELTSMVEKDATHDGKARWVLPRYPRMVELQGGSFFLGVGVRFVGEDATTELSWTAAKAYIYALYFGAIEQITRGARREETRRFIAIGQEASAEAEVMGMTVRVTVTLLPESLIPPK